MFRRSHHIPISLFILAFLLFVLLAGCNTGQKRATPPPFPSRSPNYATEAPQAAGAQHLLVMPDDGPEPILELIQGAEKSIRFKIYLFTYREVRQALIRAANRGVDVRVLIDPEPVGGGESNAETARRLQEGGVDVKWARGAFKHHHEKSLVIDDRIALIATFNFTYSSFTQNREYGLLTTQPEVVADVAAIFDADWEGEAARIVGDSPLVLSPDNSRERLTALIRSARSTLWLEQATLLDEGITRELVKAARRGVEVRFIAPKRDDDVAMENYRLLENAGARVAFLETPYVHAKVILVDGKRAFIGSVNLSYTSFELNRELGIITEDPKVVERLHDVMVKDWEMATGEKAPGRSSDAPEGVVPWKDAAQYVGQQITVQGEIVRTYDSGKVTFLNFDNDYRNTLTIVIFPSLYDAFPEPPAAHFEGKTVEVTGVVKMYEGAPEIVIEDPAQIRILKENSRQERGPATGALPSTPANTGQKDPFPLISWEEAARYIGEEAIVEGVVVRTYNSGKAAFLNFHENWRGTFSVVIFANDFDAFPQPPEKYYLNKRVRVRGKIKEYKGAPEIIVSSPAQIEVLEEVAGGITHVTPEPPKGVVPWQKAGNYLGQTITVEGRIVRVKDIGSITFLNFGKRRGDFVVVIRAKDYDNFPQPPAELYRGKKVWVTGKVTEHEGTPQIIIEHPEQIEVFD